MHRPRKRFGQNFLRDQGVIDRIVSHVAPKPNDQIVEIGPGQGALTQALLATVPSIHAVELDRDLAVILEKRFGDRLHLYQADVLKFDFDKVSDRPIRLVGNLPYNISTPLIFHVLDFAHRVQDMHFMLQKEVVDRMSAQPHNKAYGRLTVMLELLCDVEPLFDVDPEAFYPAPKVISSVVRLTPLDQPRFATGSLETLSTVLSSAFSMRRKTIRNSLKTLISAEQLVALGFDPSLRAENLSTRDFAQLSVFVHATKHSNL